MPGGGGLLFLRSIIVEMFGGNIALMLSMMYNFYRLVLCTEKKTDIATKWRNMTDAERLDWHQRARMFETQQNGASPATPEATPAAVAMATATTPGSSVEGRDRIVSYAVSLLQSCVSHCQYRQPLLNCTH